jgi:hypothetical protein
MRRGMAFLFWALAAIGAVLWIGDVLERVEGATNKPAVVRLLPFWPAAGALLEISFLAAGFLMPKNEQAAEIFSRWAIVVFVAVVTSVCSAAWLFDAIDPLSPMAFIAGFLGLWLAVGGHRAPPDGFGSGAYRRERFFWYGPVSSRTSLKSIASSIQT